MPLSPPSSAREHLHTRSITIQGYRRADGLFDLEGRLRDEKTHDSPSVHGNRKAGEPVHEMWLRLTVDSRLNIVDAEAASDAVPYPGECNRITPEYRKLVGLQLRTGFSAKVRALFSGTRGCTHLTDLIGAVATTVFQTLSGVVSQPDDRQPFQLDQCHALVTDGPTVRRFYPRWYRPAAAREAGRG